MGGALVVCFGVVVVCLVVVAGGLVVVTGFLVVVGAGVVLLAGVVEGAAVFGGFVATCEPKRAENDDGVTNFSSQSRTTMDPPAGGTSHAPFSITTCHHRLFLECYGQCSTHRSVDDSSKGGRGGRAQKVLHAAGICRTEAVHCTNKQSTLFVCTCLCLHAQRCLLEHHLQSSYCSHARPCRNRRISNDWRSKCCGQKFCACNAHHVNC